MKKKKTPSSFNSQSRAVLVLESGKVFEGFAFGFRGEGIGEVVFNTSMTGYQEILTDPSYKYQMVCMTEPLIGNVGINSEDAESRRVYCEGFIVRELSPVVSNWRAQKSLSDYLAEQKVSGITGIDTRALTRHIREVGAMRGIISHTNFNVKELLVKVKKSMPMAGLDCVKDVTTKAPYVWQENEWNWAANGHKKQKESSRFKVVVMDFGVKHNILRCLASRGCEVTVVPAKTTVAEILQYAPDGLFLSNGPGDPAAVTYAVETLKEWVAMQRSGKISPTPTMGICLGHQLLGLALGAKTFKLKFGHRGANHPVKDLTTGHIEVTTQNHGFCVDLDSLEEGTVHKTHINLNDQTLEGLAHASLPLFSVQYHPESSAGPHDSRYLFDRFIDLMKKFSGKKVYA